MQTPEFHDNLTPAQADADAITRVKEISAWFRHYQAVAPRLRVLRLKALIHLRETHSLAEMARLVDVSESRIRDILKEARHVGAHTSSSTSPPKN